MDNFAKLCLLFISAIGIIAFIGYNEYSNDDLFLYRETDCVCPTVSDVNITSTPNATCVMWLSGSSGESMDLQVLCKQT